MITFTNAWLSLLIILVRIVTFPFYVTLWALQGAYLGAYAYASEWRTSIWWHSRVISIRTARWFKGGRNGQS